jgi:hypothetical protein
MYSSTIKLGDYFIYMFVLGIYAHSYLHGSRDQLGRRELETDLSLHILDKGVFNE